MLFNSFSFIFIFLPFFILILKFLLERVPQYFIIYVSVVSLIFYSQWDITFTVLFLASIGINYSLGSFLINKRKLLVLLIGISINLLFLGYFKYANFLITNLNFIFNGHLEFFKILLPLAISFYTFQQISYLIDAYKGMIKKEDTLFDYIAFVSFFPQLIAGPIIRYNEVVPQLKNVTRQSLNLKNFSIGLTIFVIGLCKKTLCADFLSTLIDPIFKAASKGGLILLFEAWVGIIGFTLQIYFDFSGYCDMAFGLATMIGIKIPINFYSPYKATNIIEFWRRWHITLSNFFRDYVYIPLGGKYSRHTFNLLVTMLLAGLWHGASWNFIIWGGLHGVYLICAHQWRKLTKNKHSDSFSSIRSMLLTFLLVAVAWVFFRSEDFDSAVIILKGMVGLNGISFPQTLSDSLPFLSKLNFIEFSGLMRNFNFISYLDLFLIGMLLWVVFFFPNTYEIIGGVSNNEFSRNIRGFQRLILWKPNRVWAVIVSFMATFGVISILKWNQQFIYFIF